MQEANKYLEKSEYLIRTCGLQKRIKSEKVSKLHHIFSFLRIIQESTSVDWSDAGIESQNGQKALLVSAQTVDLQVWEEEDEPEDVEEDSLFVSIYQMPTTLLSLLSQTTSLRKQLQQMAPLNSDFARRCQIIEDRIFKWKAPTNLALKDSAESFQDLQLNLTDLPDASTCSAHLVSATYNALIVHFQRQIRNTDPRVLQHYVHSSADQLLAHEKTKFTLSIPAAPFPWPSFIVGCEAYDLTAREKIIEYLGIVRSYNIGSVAKSEKVIYEVWRRWDSGRNDYRWNDVLRDWNMQIILT